jgi:hypothetical protein
MPDDLLKVLTEFHRTAAVPDIRRIVNESVSSEVSSLRHEMLSGSTASTNGWIGWRPSSPLSRAE